MSDAPRKLFIITGDHSGDIHAGKVVRALKEMDPQVRIAAVGGEHVQAAGAELLSDQSGMGRVGAGSIMGAPYHYMLGRKILKFVDAFKPDAVLHIDYGVFNLWMAGQLKKRGIRTFYFIPPQVWATRKGRIKKIKKNIEHVFCIFPFEEAMYREHGIPVTYVGHPLVGELPPAADRESFCKANGLHPDKPIVGLFPGSRKSEIKFLLKDILRTVPLIRKRYPDAQFVIAKATSLDSGFFATQFRLASQGIDTTNIFTVEEQNHAVLSVADAALVKSGTTTLEAALYKTPMVIFYRLQRVVFSIAMWLLQLGSIGLPNILTDPDRPFVKELLQDDITPENLANALLPLLDKSSPEYANAMQGFNEIERKMNVGNTSVNVATQILRLISGS